jgi:hypothetical protein
LQRTLSERKLSECSFKPRINKNKKRSFAKKRSLENFLDDQNKFVEKKTRNMSYLKENLL